MKKLIIFAAIGLSLIVGCNSITYFKGDSSTSTGSSFNQETYVWENFYYPTNHSAGTYK